MKKVFQIIIILFAALQIISCGGKYDGESEGQIDFKVSYPKMDKDNFMKDFMPKKMILKFKDDKYLTNLSAGMGMFKTNFLCDLEDRKFTQMVKLINKKYLLELDDEGIAASLTNLPKFNIELTDDTKKILGYKCKKALVTIEGTDDAFSIFYTDEINIETPNWCNQFSIINGVLLEYQYEKYNICMRFTASKIEFKEIDVTEFDIPEGYSVVAEPEMDKEMKAIFESFQ